MSVAGVDEAARRLSALRESAFRAAGRAIAAEAAALAGDALKIEPGRSPLEKRLVARRADRLLLTRALLGARSVSRRLSAALMKALK